MRVAIIRFPGTNCELDTQHALEILGLRPRIIWHEEEDFAADLIILPGGFSYGDYLRCGAIAKFSPAMRTVLAHARRGGVVLGICNGFQILLESGLLPGALLANKNSSFICKVTPLRVVSNDNALLSNFAPGESFELPIAHGEGRFYADEEELKKMQDAGQILLTYEANPNGSAGDVAGICDENKRIFALMPHPERACEELLGSTVGRRIFEGLLRGVF